MGGLKLPEGEMNKRKIRELETRIQNLEKQYAFIMTRIFPEGSPIPVLPELEEPKVETPREEPEGSPSEESVEPRPPVLEGLPVLDSTGDEKEALVMKANQLGLGAPSTLRRWSLETLKSAIAEKS